MKKYISKSDFKASFDCQTKLFYRKNKYPSANDDNVYLKFLGEGGFMIEKLARMRYPDGIDLEHERDPILAAEKTQAALKKDGCSIFEAAVNWKDFHARIDVLQRQNKVLNLIEVKSASVAADEYIGSSPFINKSGDIIPKWKMYLADVAFQAMLLRNSMPDFEVVPWLCVVNKSHKADHNETLDNFKLTPAKKDSKDRPVIKFIGSEKLAQNSKILVAYDVTKEVEMLAAEVKEKAFSLATLLNDDGTITRVQESIAVNYKTCRDCEYRLSPSKLVAKNGFNECWGQMAQTPHHILDLYRVGQIGSKGVADPVVELIESGKSSLLDLAYEDLAAATTYGARRAMQWDGSKGEGKEHLPAQLKKELKSHQNEIGGPLFFLDFEACEIALPHHAGMKPFERIAFQWSCHSLDKITSKKLKHFEWLNTKKEFPNFRFLVALKECLGDAGVVYVWSNYEETTLKMLLTQILELNANSPEEVQRLSGLPDSKQVKELIAWLERFLGLDGASESAFRIRDLCDLALQHYFHPKMLGKVSIKSVLPAVWGHSKAVRENQWFKKYQKVDEAGQLLDPYKTLPKLDVGNEEFEPDSVNEGTGAIRVYQQLIFDEGADHLHRENREKLLKQYCELDTAAMVMIWQHWLEG